VNISFLIRKLVKVFWLYVCISLVSELHRLYCTSYLIVIYKSLKVSWLIKFRVLCNGLCYVMLCYVMLYVVSLFVCEFLIMSLSAELVFEIVIF
jgi:hypothetical protein